MQELVIHLDHSTFVVADLDEKPDSSGRIWAEVRTDDRKIIDFTVTKSFLRKAKSMRGREALQVHVQFVRRIAEPMFVAPSFEDHDYADGNKPRVCIY